jgi:prephenate dehydrogenase
MKIFVMGAGHMGSWLAQALCPLHEVAVFDRDVSRPAGLSGVEKLSALGEVKDFAPDLAVNAVTLPNIRAAFEELLPHLTAECMLSDIASVKTGLGEMYGNLKNRFVSTHPMFGPTFANFQDLSHQNAILIEESDRAGKEFFRGFYESFGIRVFEYTFDAHDRTIAYSLSIPFASTMVFAACMKNQDAPGSTFKKHMDIARGLLAKDDQLLSEILFNPYTIPQIEEINASLTYLTHIIRARDHEEMRRYLDRLRGNIGSRRNGDEA